MNFQLVYSLVAAFREFYGNYWAQSASCSLRSCCWSMILSRSSRSSLSVEKGCTSKRWGSTMSGRLAVWWWLWLDSAHFVRIAYSWIDERMRRKWNFNQNIWLAKFFVDWIFHTQFSSSLRYVEQVLCHANFPLYFPLPPFSTMFDFVYEINTQNVHHSILPQKVSVREGRMERKLKIFVVLFCLMSIEEEEFSWFIKFQLNYSEDSRALSERWIKFYSSMELVQTWIMSMWTLLLAWWCRNCYLVEWRRLEKFLTIVMQIWMEIVLSTRAPLDSNLSQYR